MRASQGCVHRTDLPNLSRERSMDLIRLPSPICSALLLVLFFLGPGRPPKYPRQAGTKRRNQTPEIPDSRFTNFMSPKRRFSMAE